MKRVILFTSALLASSTTLSSPAVASEVGTVRRIGFGLQIADPLALIGKAFLDRNNAIDFGFGFWGYGRCYNGYNNDYYYCNNSSNFNDTSNFYSIHVDWLHEENIVDQVVRLDWHVGAGGRTIYWNYHYTSGHHWVMLARAPIGLDLAFRKVPWLETYFELAPAIQLTPGLDFTFDLGLGARAYF